MQAVKPRAFLILLAEPAWQLFFTREMQKCADAAVGFFEFAFPFLVNSCTYHSAVNPPILLIHPWELVDSVAPCLQGAVLGAAVSALT